MARPSNKWFPQSLQDRAAWYQNFTTQFALVGASLGFTPAEITVINNDNQVMQFLAQAVVDIEAFKKASVQYREIITEGDIGDPTPVFPANPTLDLPVTIPTGMFERLNNYVARIKAAPAYTDETGALLGILPIETGSISPEDVKPSIEAFAAQNDYHFAIVVANRVKADSWEVEILREGAVKWQNIKTATGKSVDVEVQPTVEGKPERIQVRVQLIKSNEPYGQPSDPTFVTLNP